MKRLDVSIVILTRRTWRYINLKTELAKAESQRLLPNCQRFDDFAKLHSIAETAMKNGDSKFNAILALAQL